MSFVCRIIAFQLVAMGCMLWMGAADAATPSRGGQKKQEAEQKKTFFGWALQLELTGDPEEAQQAAVELARFGAKAVPVFSRVLKDNAAFRRREAAIGLRYLGKAAESALPTLEELAARDENQLVRIEAIASAGVISGNHKAAVEALKQYLSSKETFVRLAAIRSFLLFPFVAGDYVEQIVPLLNDTREDVKLAAIRVIGFLGPKADRALQPLINIYQKGSSSVKEQVVSALGILGWNAASVVDYFRQQLSGNDSAMQSDAVLVLGSIGPKAAPAIPDLQKLFASSKRLRADAVLAIVRIDDSGKVALPKLQELYQQETDYLVRMRIAAALPLYGEKSLPLLGEMLKDKSPDVLIKALGAVAELGAKASELVPSIVPHLSNRLTDVQLAATQALAAIGQPSEAATRELSKLAMSENSSTAMAAAYALAKMKISPEKNLQIIQRFVESKDPEERQQAITRLGLLGKDAAPAVPTLLKKVDSEDLFVIVQALDNISKDAAAKCLPSLEKKLESEIPGERIAAAHWINTLTGNSQKTTPVLANYLKYEDEFVRESAVLALAELKDKAKPMAESISALLQDPSHRVRLAAAYTLAMIEPGNAKAMETMQLYLTRVLPGIDLRRSAIYYLDQLGAGAKGAVSSLQETARYSNDPFLRRAAQEVLSNIR